MQAHHPSLSSDQIAARRQGHAPAPTLDLASRSASFGSRRAHSDESWVEISSQPSSSSLSSINDEIVTAGMRVQQDPRARRRRALRPGAISHLNITHRAQSAGATSSQEEYEESESESDRVMTSSGEGGLLLPAHIFQHNVSPAVRSIGSQESAPDEDDENRTAINYPIRNETCFTPQRNAFSHPPSGGQMRNASAPVPGSYFPSTRPPTRPTARQSYPAQQSHMPQNILSPSYNAAAQHDEALRASLSTLLSVAAAARGQAKPDTKRPQSAATAPMRNHRAEPMSFRLIPESAVPISSPPRFHEPTFAPTIRRTSTATSASSSPQQQKDHKRKAPPPTTMPARNSSRERRALKKARRSSSSEDLGITPTLLTWVVSAGVVVVLSALSFSAGYNLGKEAGRIEASEFVGGEQIRGCAREAGRSGLGLRRSLARSVQV